MKVIEKIFSYIKSMRPETWFIGGVPLIFMSILASKFNFSFSMIIGTFSLFFISIIFVLGATNMFNEVFDIEADKFNKPHRPIVSKKITRKSAFFLSSMLFILALIWSFLLSINIFYLTAIAVFFGIAYSLPHVRFKDYALSSMLTLGTGYGFLIPISPWILFSENEILIGLLITVISFSWFFGVTNSKDFKDVPGDKLKGTKTLPILIGEKRTINVMIVLMTFIPCSLLVLYALTGIFPLGTLLALIPNIINFYYLGWLKKHYSPENAFRYYKWVYIIYPLFFVFLTIGFWLGGYIV
jgi:4-hydroxybenzoate polyprenyltransferase